MHMDDAYSFSMPYADGSENCPSVQDLRPNRREYGHMTLYGGARGRRVHRVVVRGDITSDSRGFEEQRGLHHITANNF